MRINPTQMSDQQSTALYRHLVDNQPLFLDRKSTHVTASSSELQVTHNLIWDESSTTEEKKRYYVISNDGSDLLGEGASSKVRKAIGFIELDGAAQSCTYTPSEAKSVKITNTKYAQERNQQRSRTYKHKEAVQAYEACIPFAHLGVQKPIKRGEYVGTSGFFFKKKSYTLMQTLPGTNFSDAIREFIAQQPNVLAVLNLAVIPLLETYKKQIAQEGYIHRDIKSGNINATFDLAGKSQINFLDCDKSIKINETDTAFGSPGFLAPELTGEQQLPASTARDIFSLGVLIVECFNPRLGPDYHMMEEYQVDNVRDAFEFALAQLEEHGSYDPDQMLTPDQEHYNLFEFINDSEFPEDLTASTYEKIKSLIKAMTNINPALRPCLDEAIGAFKKLENELVASKGLVRKLSR